jgi:hypothetical protein
MRIRNHEADGFGQVCNTPAVSQDGGRLVQILQRYTVNDGVNGNRDAIA